MARRSRELPTELRSDSRSAPACSRREAMGVKPLKDAHSNGEKPSASRTSVEACASSSSDTTATTTDASPSAARGDSRFRSSYAAATCSFTHGSKEKKRDKAHT